MTLELLRGGHNAEAGVTSSAAYDRCVDEALSRVALHIASNVGVKNVVGVIQFHNLPILLFSYGLEYAKQMTDKLVENFYTQFKDKVCLEKISSDTLLFNIAGGTEEAIFKELKSLFLNIKRISCVSVEKPAYTCFSCGTVVFNEGMQLNEAVNKAYMALFECKDNGGYAHCTYNQEISKKMLKHSNDMKLAAYLQRAILEKRLRLAFQPIIDSKTGKTKHHEALLRIITDDGKIISAGPFIPIAESMRFVDQIDFLVLNLVVSELRFDANVMLAMNISNLSIGSSEWISKAKQLLQDPSIASRLIIEITETGIHNELSKIGHFVEVMQSLGCMVAIDDFGAGYTSFTQLKTIHADIIKIDGAFIRDIVENHDSQLFVHTLLELAHSFGIKTVAEFVETGEIAKALIELNVDYMQGNYFSPALNYRTWVKEDVYKLLN